MADHDPERAAAREDLCRFLSACYYEPDPAFAEERLFDSILQAAQRLDPELGGSARQLGAAFAAQDLQTLLVDYTRLFLGPVQPLAKPYGSFWLTGEGTVMQDSTLELQELYREAGFDIDEEFRELPDHVAVELEFLYLLIFKRNEARRAGHAEVIASWDLLHRTFLARHLGAWVGRFSAAVKSAAQTDFYRELAALTERFVRMETAAAALA
jgi:putative dimethyl sulfoxide reductase chaperone